MMHLQMHLNHKHLLNNIYLYVLRTTTFTTIFIHLSYSQLIFTPTQNDDILEDSIFLFIFRSNSFSYILCAYLKILILFMVVRIILCLYITYYSENCYLNNSYIYGLQNVLIILT